MSRKAMRWVVTTLAAAAAGTAIVLACGPFFTDLATVSRHTPADLARYRRGDLGIVKPTFWRRYLVQAYRTLEQLPQVPPENPNIEPPDRTSPVYAWLAIERAHLPPDLAPAQFPRLDRRAGEYSWFQNCLEPAFEHAAETYAARVARYGSGSREVADWVAAQVAVFRNCAGETLVLPQRAPPWSDAQLRADREYQTAAAYFYATQFDEAARRFRAMAGNSQSPWRSTGRYLAARAMIRSANVPTDVPDAAARYATAEQDLQATLADSGAAALHPSARGLLTFIAARARPADRLRELSRRLATSADATPQELIDYTRLMDVAYRESTSPTPPIDLDGVRRDAELTDWIVATQRGGDRARQRWRESGNARWLIAAMWTTPPTHADAPALIDAAARVPPTSPAFATAAILRVRLLIRRGDVERTRTVLQTLPAGAGADAETRNLLQAARLTVAANLDDLLKAAPREEVASDYRWENEPWKPAGDKPIWDKEVAALFNGRFPLEQLVAAAESTVLPTRLRLRVAQSAFTRAVILRQPDAGTRAARVLHALAPWVAVDLDRYLAATTEDARHRAAVLTLLRTPGLSINVRGADDDTSYDRVEPFREFGHAFPRNWWCRVEDTLEDGAESLVTGTSEIASPLFFTDAQRLAAAREVAALRAAGEPRAYLMSAAIDWARERPTDRDAAEALARSIEGWRWSPCDYGVKSDLPRRAFARLHRQFPASEWAKRTKYWYQ